MRARTANALYTAAVSATDLARTLAKLPPDLREEVADFASFLLEKHTRAQKRSEPGHPLAKLAGAWADEPLSDEELLPERTLSRPVDL